jgi:hypothetical protein
VVAADQPPQPLLPREAGHEGGPDAHVGEVLEVQRRHAAEGAARHVHVATGDGREPREQRRRLVGHVDQHPDPVLQVQLAGLLGDVGGGIVQAEERLEVRPAGLAHHLPVAVRIELVHHDPVVPGQVPHHPHRLVVERLQRRGGVERRKAGGQHPGHPLGHVLARGAEGIRHLRLQLHRDPLGPEPHAGGLEPPDPVGILDRRGRRHRSAQFVAVAQLANQVTELGIEAVDGTAERGGAPRPQDGLRVERGLKHVELLGMQHQQDSVRLHGAGQLNKLPVAVGEIGSPEGRVQRLDVHE